jgi:hypothetical protein
VVSTAGTISAIYMTNAGLGYSVAPTIVVAAPASSSSGNFVFNEIVTGSVSGTTARVRIHNAVTNTLEIATISGDFVAGETVTGGTSGATAEIRVVSTEPNDDGFADNINIETEADSIIDFSEQNPFGMP